MYLLIQKVLVNPKWWFNVCKEVLSVVSGTLVLPKPCYFFIDGGLYLAQWSEQECANAKLIGKADILTRSLQRHMNRKYSSLCKRRKCSGTESKVQTPKSSSENNKKYTLLPSQKQKCVVFVCLFVFFLTTMVYALGHRNDALTMAVGGRMTFPEVLGWVGSSAGSSHPFRKEIV